VTLERRGGSNVPECAVTRVAIRPGPVVVALCGIALAACQSNAPSTSTPEEASPEAHALSRKIAETIARCWFAPGETAFAGYIYSPEPNAVVPRVLIVRKDQPAERPVLVVEATGATTVSSYGPLLQSPNSARISADLSRWAKGNTSCS
jgi:hypothetical protein